MPRKNKKSECKKTIGLSFGGQAKVMQQYQSLHVEDSSVPGWKPGLRTTVLHLFTALSLRELLLLLRALLVNQGLQLDLLGLLNIQNWCVCVWGTSGWSCCRLENPGPEGDSSVSVFNWSADGSCEASRVNSESMPWGVRGHHTHNGRSCLNPCGVHPGVRDADGNL